MSRSLKSKLKLVVLLMVALTLALSPVSLAAGCEKDDRFLGLPYWHRGLSKGASCEITINNQNDLTKIIPTIALNIGESLAIVAGIVSTGMIIYGGLMYVLALGDQSKISGAKKTIQNSIIGLVIAILATAIIETVFGIFL